MRIAGKTVLAATAALALLLATPRAHATVLPINSTVVPNAQANPLTGTTILGNTGVQNFNVSLNGSSIVGTAQEWVVTGFAGNPFGANDLTFVVQVALTGGQSSSGGPAVLERVTTSGFDTVFATDAGYNATGSQVIPTSADRSASGDVVGFNFISPGSNIGVGQSSALLIINSNATSYRNTTLTVQDGLTANVNGFGPAVPEPSSLALCGVGLSAGLVMFVRRRNNPRA